MTEQGFIHCSTLKQIGEIEDYFRNKEKMNNPLRLIIDSQKVQDEIKYEGHDAENYYPHIYGPLNLDAVINVQEIE